MILNVGLVLQLTVVLSLLFAVGGLVLGLSLQREVDGEVKGVTTFLSLIIGIVVAVVTFIMAVGGCESVIAYELCGLIIVLSCLSMFLGVGLYIGPFRGR